MMQRIIYRSKRQSIIADLRNKYSYLSQGMSNRQVLIQLYAKEKQRSAKNKSERV